MILGLTAAALGAAGLISSIANNSKQNQQYQQNYDFMRYQYEDSKKYNSAQEQVKRLRAAGINPSLAFGQNAGMAQSVSAPSNPNTSPLDLNGLAAIGSGVSLNDVMARNIQANTDNKNVETDKAKIDLGFANEEWLSKLYNRDSDSWYKDMMSKNIKLNNTYLQDTMKDRIWMQKMQSQEQQARAYAQHYLLPYVPLKAQAELENLAANTKLALNSGVATLKQAHAAIMNAETTKKAFQAQYGDNPKMWKQFSEATFDYLVQQKSTAESQEFNNYLFKGEFSAGSTGISYPQAYSYDKKSRSFKRHY